VRLRVADNADFLTARPAGELEDILPGSAVGLAWAPGRGHLLHRDA